MSQAVVVDASLWVARLVNEDVFHKRSRDWFAARRAEGALFVAPALLLVEVAAAISRRTGRPDLARQAVDLLQRLPDLRLVQLDRGVIQAAVEVAASLGVRGADAFYIAVAERLRLPLATLDRDQARRAEQRIAVLRLGPDGAFNGTRR